MPVGVPGVPAAWAAAPCLALVLLLAACAGFEPMAMPDQRENPDGRGVFSGESGEFVIFRR